MRPSSPNDGSDFERERDQVLRALVSPLVHGANNHLAVVQGALELGAAAAPAEVSAAHGASERLSALLRRLTLLAKDPAPTRAPVPVTDLLFGVEDLLVPYAAAGGIELTVDPGAGAEAVLDGPRLSQALLVYVGAWIGALRAGALRARGRVALHRGRGGPALTLTLGMPFGGEPAPAALARLEELALGEDLPFRVRTLGRARRVSLGLAGAPAQTPAATPGGDGVEPAPRRRARLLYFGPEGEDTELSVEVLREHGFVVTASHAPPEAAVSPAACDAILLDGDLERDHPGSLARVEAHVLGLNLPLGLLGTQVRPGGEPYPELGKPIRPRELLAFVTGLLRPRVREPY